MKDAHVNIRTTDEHKKKLAAICKQEHRSQSQQIEYWITSTQVRISDEEVAKMDRKLNKILKDHNLTMEDIKRIAEQSEEVKPLT